MTVDVRDAQMRQLVDEQAEVVQLASGGYRPSEGPIWIAEGEYLLYSDVSQSRRFRWDAAHGATQVAAETNCGNGMTLDLEGRLVVCGGAQGEILRMDADGTGAGTEVLASHYEGKRLNSPNDIVVAADGSIYFTDPWWAHMVGVDREQDLDFQGIYRIAPNGALELVADDFEFPDGLCFSPDESILYINDFDLDHIRAFDVQPDGSLANGRIFADDIRADDHGGKVDGMKCDEHGNVWVTGPYGIWVFTPDGTHLGVVEIPERAQNFHWGGADWKSVFVTASASLYRFEAKVAGRREAFMAAAG
jgi:gluconolactonase